MQQHATNDHGFMGLSHSEQLMALGVFLLPALALVVPSGYSYGPIFILIGAVMMLATTRCLISRDAPLPRAVQIVVVVFMLYALYWMVDGALRGEGLRDTDRPSRFLLAALCLVALTRARLRPALLWTGLAIGSIAAGGIAIWQKQIEGVVRTSGFTNPIQFGNAAMLMGLMCLAGLIWAWQPNRLRGQQLLLAGLLLMGGVAGIAGSFLSGTRGAWLALMPAVFISMWPAWRLGRVRVYLLVAPMLLATIVAGAYLHPTTQVASRVSSAIDQTEQYFAGTNKNSSVGLRFEMWRAAWQMFSEQPILGTGESSYRARLNAMAQTGVITPAASNFDRAHNELLDTLAKKGVVGTLVLATLYLAPLMGFFNAGQTAGDKQTVDRSRLALATAGVVFTVGYISVGVTAVTLSRNGGVMIYAFMTVVLLGLCYQRPAKAQQADLS